MPTWQSVEAFNREIDRLDRTLNRELQNATREMAENARRVALSEARSDLGGDTRFSGWSGRDLSDLVIKRGRRVGVNDTSHWMFPTRKSGGPWKVAEYGRNTTTLIGPTVRESSVGISGRRKRAGRRSFKRWNGITAGKGTASNAADRFNRDSERIAEKRFRTALTKHFDVS